MDQAVKEAPRTEPPVLPNHWNHANFSVPPERFREVEACFDALFDWEKYLARDDIVGYRLVDNSREGAVYVRPTEAAGKIHGAIARLRAQDKELDEGIRELEALSPDFNDHLGFAAESPEEWERQVAHFEQVSREHPEWQITVRPYRAGEPGAPSRLHQAFLRIGILGPIRNTIEMQTPKRD